MHRTLIRGLAALALGLALSPDGRFAAVTHSGWHAKGLDLVDLESASRTQHVPLAETWLGVAFIDGGRTLAVSAGHTNRVLLFPIRDGRAGTADTIVVGPPWTAGGQYPQGKRIEYGPGAIWVTGLCSDEATQRLFVVSRLDSALSVLDTRGRRLLGRVPLGAVPYTCLVSRDGRQVADVVPYDVLNRILWHSVRGTAAPPPPIVRSGFALGTRRDDVGRQDDGD